MLIKRMSRSNTVASNSTDINYQVSLPTLQSSLKYSNKFQPKFSAFMQRKCPSQFANLMSEHTFLQAVNVVLIYDINAVSALRPGAAFIPHYRRKSF